MSHPQINDVVRLLQDVPDLGLSCGQQGIVRSTWFTPFTAYEVEFRPQGLTCQTRALLLNEQIQVDRAAKANQQVPIPSA